ncbi:MAG: AAA family ATPase [Gammaproteobacteria bacterium]|nr:AAA family ATPase [Gammaproteobacteria bacterium]
MKILNLKIQGYRSLKDVSWVPGSLNVLIGPNGSGKSNILRVLEMISISARGRLGKHIQRAGGMDPLVWDGIAEIINFSIKAAAERDSLTYDMTIERIGKGSTYRIAHELLGNYHRVEKGERAEPFKLIERIARNAVVFDENERSLTASGESIMEEESLLSLASGPFTQNHFIPPFQAYLAGWSIYHDLHVNMDAAIRQPTITRHETRVEADGQNLISVLHTLYTSDRDFKNDINLAMRAAFGDEFDELIFPPAADQRIQLRVRWKTLSREQSAADLSDGTLRFLFLLTILASPDPAPLIAIDEPETGLHPLMLPIVAEYAMDASERTQVILTTHSPQLLDAFKELVPKTTVVKWSEGETDLQNVEGEQLDRWLKEYSLGSLFRSGELENGLAGDEVSSDMAGRE